MLNIHEMMIARRIIEDALYLDYKMSVYDGEETIVHKSSDFWEVYGALGTTDYDAIRFYADGKLIGSVALVWGNDTDVIHDWSDTPEIDRLMRGPFQTASLIDRECGRF